mmetsp:Transcript_32317/g.39703  ORF Transcript_32317/g.39703 Transcript_32317/m.39703 type:complete len:156 (-) Transcript_32317:1004-1471(-)
MPSNILRNNNLRLDIQLSNETIVGSQPLASILRGIGRDRLVVDGRRRSRGVSRSRAHKFRSVQGNASRDLQIDESMLQGRQFGPVPDGSSVHGGINRVLYEHGRSAVARCDAVGLPPGDSGYFFDHGSSDDTDDDNDWAVEFAGDRRALHAGLHQ